MMILVILTIIIHDTYLFEMILDLPSLIVVKGTFHEESRGPDHHKDRCRNGGSFL